MDIKNIYSPREWDKPKKGWLEKILAIIFVLFILAGVVYAAKIGMDGSEKSECLKWKEEAEQFPLWYSTDWQRAQCEHWGLPLPR